MFSLTLTRFPLFPVGRKLIESLLRVLFLLRFPPPPQLISGSCLTATNQLGAIVFPVSLQTPPTLLSSPGKSSPPLPTDKKAFSGVLFSPVDYNPSLFFFAPLLFSQQL